MEYSTLKKKRRKSAIGNNMMKLEDIMQNEINQS